jgi:hypothetical protein
MEYTALNFSLSVKYKSVHKQVRIVRFEVLRAVIMKIGPTTFWNVTPCTALQVH